MTDVSMDVLNRRAALAAVHSEAERVGADPEVLLDSQRFYGAVTALSPDDPGYHRKVRELVAGAAGQAQAPAQGVPQQPGSSPGTQQWTIADVKGKSQDQVLAAMDAGYLVDLGYGPRRRPR